MKRLALALALFAAFGASAQDSSTSSGTATSSSSSAPTVNTSSGNSSSNVQASGSASANPNNANAQNVIFNTSSGGASSMDSTSKSTSDSNSTQTYSGVQRNINEGTSTQNVVYSGTQTVKNVPSIQMSGPASGPCTGVSGGVGLSGPGWGFGVNGSAVMDDCRLRENTRVLGMAMQSIDGNANPQERGEVTVLFMDSVRNLAAYNNTIYNRAVKEAK